MNFQKLVDFMDNMAATRTPGCVCVIYKDGQKIFDYATGYASLEKGIKLTGQEYFNLYSCSKITTVTAAIQLLEKGVILLNDPLSDYIPEYAHMKIKQADGSLVDAKKPITIGDLFSMTAGFNYDLEAPFVEKARQLTNGKMDTVTVTRCLADEPLSFEPGAHWQYSLCHDALAGLVAVLTDMPFRDYVQKNVFDPLEMDKAVYHVTPEIEAQMSEQYTFIPKGEEEVSDLVEAQRAGKAKDGSFKNVGKGVRFIFGPEYDSGGAGITSTTADYVKLIAALANGGTGLNGAQILQPKTVELLKTNRIPVENLGDIPWPQLKGYGYGLGLRTHLDQKASGCLANLGEFGWCGAAGASAIIDSKENLAVFFTQHMLNPREEWYHTRLKNVIYSCLKAD